MPLRLLWKRRLLIVLACAPILTGTCACRHSPLYPLLIPPSANFAFSPSDLSNGLTPYPSTLPASCPLSPVTLLLAAPRHGSMCLARPSTASAARLLPLTVSSCAQPTRSSLKNEPVPVVARQGRWPAGPRVVRVEVDEGGLDQRLRLPLAVPVMGEGQSFAAGSGVVSREGVGAKSGEAGVGEGRRVTGRGRGWGGGAELKAKGGGGGKRERGGGEGTDGCALRDRGNVGDGVGVEGEGGEQVGALRVKVAGELEGSGGGQRGGGGGAGRGREGDGHREARCVWE